ncbi:MAG: hypothetical protein O6826_05400, partial [Acidobacteria bacterium]|nr:hypothetical protein [Acidobacteriota bacterium]
MKQLNLARMMHKFFTAATDPFCSVLVLLLLGSLTFGQDFSRDETVARITANLMCTCGCPHI